MLRSKMLSVDYFRVNTSFIVSVSYPITQLIKRFHDDLEGPSLIMAFQVLNIFQNKRSRTLYFKNLSNIEKQSSLSLALKSVCTAEGVFLRHTCNRKWLAGKSSQQNMMIRNQPRPSAAEGYLLCWSAGLAVRSLLLY